MAINLLKNDPIVWKEKTVGLDITFRLHTIRNLTVIIS